MEEEILSHSSKYSPSPCKQGPADAVGASQVLIVIVLLTSTFGLEAKKFCVCVHGHLHGARCRKINVQNTRHSFVKNFANCKKNNK